MRDPVPVTIFLKDYTPPAFLVPKVELDFDIAAEHTTVRATLWLERNPASADKSAPLVLDGEALELVSVSIDGKPLAAGEYAVDDASLRIASLPDRCTLQTVVRIDPRANTQLSGLYASKTGLFTQCEAQGFRRITFFPDRPDVMSRYTVTIHADRATYPQLLSNGNLVASGEDGARHWAKWEDPFAKPAYLFALVAAKLDMLEDHYTTASGRRARLAIYVEPGKLDQCGHAMACLKSSMKWDEEVFGLELDLDGYMIVAVGDFNMGAMENKGLNVFNTKYVLARPDVATDTDFMNIDRVVAHEYFHNWTGNRVTCRDWFQLSLKEGLTVFRDQEYGADHYSRAVQRTQEVRGLRAAQFPEDAGPMAHPIRPASYMEISNFYTATVYEKGAEVVRMIHTLLGAQGFRRGMDLYFQRHDGQAVTTEDFVAAMADANGADLTQFRRWYEQAGTPVLDCSGTYDAAAKRYTLNVRQSVPDTPGQSGKLPMHIPFAVGLIAADGKEVPLRLAGEAKASGNTRVLSLREAEHSFVFEDVPAAPVPSLARGFSAPVVLNFAYTEAELTHLMAHDSDSFNRWEAGQRLAANLILAGAAGKPVDPSGFVAACARILAHPTDPAFVAEALSLPSETTLAEQIAVVDPVALHASRNALRRAMADGLHARLLSLYAELAITGPYSPDAASMGRRALRNLCLSLLMERDDAEARGLALAQFASATNMTDSAAALVAIANSAMPERKQVLEQFHARWKDEPLVVDKWLVVQATSRLPGTLTEVEALMRHPSFDIRNPNKVYALIRAFCANHLHFHAADGSGYAFGAARVIELDALNPQVASRVARSFDRWRKFDAGRQAHAKRALEQIRRTAGLSRDVSEIVTKALFES